MYIPEFWCGFIGCILFEFALVILAAVFNKINKTPDYEQEKELEEEPEEKEEQKWSILK